MSIEPLMKKKWNFNDMPDQSGKIVVVTGANSGLGFIATRELAKRNAEVIMACRNLEKAGKAKNDILKQYPNAKLHVMKLDQASLASVKTFAEEFKSKFSKLDILLNNAGIMQPPKRETEDGFELQIGVNHLGQFALTGQLFDALKKSKNARVVAVSSIAHKTGKINFEDLMSEKKYSRNAAYSQSKFANVLFGYELARKLKEHNINNIKSVVSHPGYSNTSLQQNGPAIGGKSMLSRIYAVTDRLIAMSADKGSLSLLYACTMPDVESGDFIGPGGIYQARGFPKRYKSVKSTYNEEDAKKLWEVSENLTGIKFSF